MTLLTQKDLDGIALAQGAIQLIEEAVPTSLSGPQLVHAICCLLEASAPANKRNALLGSTGIAAAAIAALVEERRAHAAGERSVVA